MRPLVPLLLALALFTCYLTLRARASFNVLRAAYPTERISFKRIWGAYFAGYGFNAVIPARGGRRHVLHIINSMMAPREVKTSSTTDLGVLLRSALQIVPRRSLGRSTPVRSPRPKACAMRTIGSFGSATGSLPPSRCQAS